MTLYSRGAYAERKAKKELEKAGFLVIRAAGSKGPVDLVAISTGEVLAIQVKSHDAPLTSNERDRLHEIAQRTPANTHIEVWTYGPSGALEVIRYQRDG